LQHLRGAKAFTVSKPLQFDLRRAEWFSMDMFEWGHHEAGHALFAMAPN
jgi:hypothetical protein